MEINEFQEKLPWMNGKKVAALGCRHHCLVLLQFLAVCGVAGVGDEVVCNSRRPYELMLSNSFKVKSTKHHNNNNSNHYYIVQPLNMVSFPASSSSSILATSCSESRLNTTSCRKL